MLVEIKFFIDWKDKRGLVPLVILFKKTTTIREIKKTLFENLKHVFEDYEKIE